MKRVLSLCLAAVLTLGLLGSSAFAGEIQGFNANIQPFADTTARYKTNSTDEIYLPIGFSTVVTDGGTLSRSEMDKLDIAVSTNDLSTFKSLFEHRYVDYYNGELCVILKPYATASGSYQFRMGMTYLHDSGGIAVQQITNSAYIQTIQFNIQSNIVGDGSITGFQPSSPSTINESISVGTPLYFNIPSSGVFHFNGNDTALTQAKLNDAGIQASSSNTNITATLDYTNGCRVKVSANTNNTGTQTGTIKLTSSKFSGEHILFNYTFEVTTGSTTGNKITGIDGNARLGQDINSIWGRTGRNGKELPSDETLGSMTVKPGDIVTFEFNSDFFLWQNGKPSPSAWVNKSTISNGKITVKRTGSSSGTNVIDTLEMRYDNNRAYVYLKFKDNLSTTKETDFSFSVALAYNGSTVSGTGAEVGGTMTYDHISVYEGDEYVDLSGGEIAEAEDGVSKVDVYIGEGVTITVRMTKGKQYKGSVSLEVSNSDQAVLDKYPDIEYVYTLTTSGLSQTGNIVSFDLGDTYYAYDKDVKYLGRTNAKLPYSTKYYLSTKQLDVETDVQGSGDVVEVPSMTTPGPVTTGNGNYNPATGR